MNKIFFIIAILFSGVASAQWKYEDLVREMYITNQVIPINNVEFPKDSFNVTLVWCSANEKDSKNLDIWDKRIPSRIGKATTEFREYYRQYGYEESIAIYHLSVYASGKNYAIKIAESAIKY